MDGIAGIDEPGRAVDVGINRLRKKIEVDPKYPIWLQTVRGKGYILRPELIMKIKIPILKSLKKISPTGLYSRSLIIIIMPIVILQAILTFVFLERHWELVTRKLSASVVSDIGMILDMQKNLDIKIITSNAKKFYDITINFLPNKRILQQQVLPRNLLEKTLTRELITGLNKKAFVRDILIDKKVMIEIEMENGVFEFLVPRRNVYATNSHIFLVWMVISSILIFQLRILFLRQQIKTY